MSEAKSDLHEAARKLASNGVPVFPCWPGTKRPYTEHGFHDATTDLEQIDAWWSVEPRLNLAYCPHLVGLAIIDTDGDDGEGNWGGWQIDNGFLPLTYTIQTPSDGFHRYYAGSLPPTQSKLAMHVDTRGIGSYVLAPPSYVEYEDGSSGYYRVVDGRAPAPLPDTVNDYLTKLAKDRVRAAIHELDLPQNIVRASAHLRQLVVSGNVAIEGHNGDKNTYVTACDVMNLGCSPEKALELMVELWNPHCQPPWDEDELEVKIQNAARYAQNEAGAWAVGSTSDVFGSALDKLAPELLEDPTDTDDERPKGPPRFKRWTLGEMLRLPPPEWLLPDLMPAHGVSVLYGQPGTLKTFIAVGWACELASMGIPVLYVAAEGAIGVSQRIAAWCMVHEIDPTTLPIELVRAAPAAAEPSQLKEFMYHAVVPFKPSLIIVDTLARTAVGLDENSARDMGQIVEVLNGLADASRAAVLVVHHSGKDGDRGPRGSGALIGGVEAMFEATRPDKEKPFVRVKCTRQKDAPERAAPWLYEGRQVGEQMVVQECALSEFHEATATLPKLRGADLGAALRALGAIGEDHGVSTNVLADKLAEMNGKTPEEKEALKTGYATVVGRGAGGLREAYSTGSPPIWSLPSEETT